MAMVTAAVVAVGVIICPALAQPHDGESPQGHSPTGQLLTNADFADWRNEWPLAWSWKPLPGSSLTRAEPGQPARLRITRPDDQFVDLAQAINEPDLRQGESVLVRAEVRCMAPRDVLVLLRLYARQEGKDAGGNQPNARAGEWETVTLLAPVPDSGVARLVVGVRVGPEAAAPVEVRNIQAWVIPSVP